MFNAIFRLRRDNDYNYAKVKNTFVPQDGEICLVDTAKDGLRAVCGDGITPFGKLEYLNDFIKKGYLKDNVFYSNKEYTTPLSTYTSCLYIDLNTNHIYFIKDEQLQKIDTSATLATEFTAGIMKLYSTTGENVDGTMTQKAITKELNSINDELDDKVEISLKKDEELLIFTF